MTQGKSGKIDLKVSYGDQIETYSDEFAENQTVTIRVNKGSISTYKGMDPAWGYLIGSVIFFIVVLLFN